MPRTTLQSKRYRNKRRYRRRRLNLYNLSKRITALSKTTNKMIETKELTTPWTTSVGSTPLIYQMDTIAQGDTEVQRVGIEVCPKTLNFYLRLTGENPLTTGDSNVVRVIVFRWFDNTFPLATDLLYNNAAGAFTGYPYVDIPTVWTAKPRFQVLCDKRIVLDEDNSDHAFFKFNHKFRKGAKIHYSGSAPTAIENKNLFYMIVSDSSVVPHPIFTGYSRLTYKDA